MGGLASETRICVVTSWNYLQPIRWKLMAMSSFLMTSVQYTEPKFPPADEFSQQSYIPNHGTDYYRSNYQTHYGYPDPRRFDDDKYTPNQYGGCTSNAPVSPPQPSPPVSNHGGGGGGGGTMNGFASSQSSTPSPPPVPSPDENSSPLSQSSCAQQQSDGQPVIYPWMKKSQGNNPGKYMTTILVLIILFAFFLFLVDFIFSFACNVSNVWCLIYIRCFW